MFFKIGQIYILSSLCYEATVLGEGRLETRVETHGMWFNAGGLTLLQPRDSPHGVFIPGSGSSVLSQVLREGSPLVIYSICILDLDAGKTGEL